MREFGSQIKMKDLVIPVTDYQLDATDINLQGFSDSLDNDFKKDSEIDQEEKERFKQEVIGGLTLAFSNGEIVYLSNLVRGMHNTLTDVTAKSQVKLAVGISEYASALILNTNKDIQISAKRFSAHVLWQGFMGHFNESNS